MDRILKSIRRHDLVHHVNPVRDSFDFSLDCRAANTGS